MLPHAARPVVFAVLSVVVAIRPAPAQQPPPLVQLTLGEAARLAARQGAAALQGRFGADAASARATKERAALFPALGASVADGQRTFNTASFGVSFPGFDPAGEVLGPVRTVDLRGRLTFNLLDPVRRGDYRRAEAEANEAALGATASADDAAALAVMAYLRALRAEALVAARAADSALAGELLGIAQAQLDAGVGVRLDVTRAESQLAGMRAQLIASRNERARAAMALSRSLGLPATTVVLLRDSLTAIIPAISPDGVVIAVAQARHDRPDLRTAIAAVETAQRREGASRAERLPVMSLFADKGVTGTGYAHLLGTYNYGVQLSVALFDGFHRRGRTAEAEALRRQAESRRDELEADIEAQVRGALLDLASAEDALGAVRDQLRLHEAELAQARERFRAGVAGNADVITAQLGLNTARNQWVEGLVAAQAARLALARAEGQLTALP